MASLKKCIAEKCRQCTYDPCIPGTYLMQIESCTVRSCPLWEVRPVTISTVQLNRKTRTEAGSSEIDIDSIVDSLENDDGTSPNEGAVV